MSASFNCQTCQAPLIASMPWIEKHSARFKCSNCKKISQFSLPPLNRKLICIDQNVVSEMMKVSSDSYPDERKHRIKPAWGKVYRLTIESCKELVAAFPLSLITGEESSLCVHGPAILDLAERISQDLTLRDSSHLVLAELSHNYRRWLEGEQDPEPIQRSQAYDSDITAWPKHPRISIKREDNYFVTNQVKTSRDQLNEWLQRVYDRWRNEKLPIGRVKSEEANSSGPAFFKSIVRASQTRHALSMFNPNAIAPIALANVYENYSGKLAEDYFDSIKDFFHSKFYNGLPSVEIRSWLYAAQSCRIAGGMKNPRPSDKFDVERVTSFLPYVDAIVLENHFAALLREILPKLPHWAQSVQIFSCRELHSYSTYLKGLLDTKPDPSRVVLKQLFK